MARYRAGFGRRHVAVLVAAGLFTAACGGTIPPGGSNATLTAPSALTPAAGTILTGETSRTLAKDVVMFSLVNGRFKFRTTRGDLTGTYGGVVTVPPRDRSIVAMTLQVTEGSNQLVGATGTLVGDGSGAFVTGGQFVLSLTGDLRTSAEPQNSKFHATVVGTATLPITCSASNHFILQLRGEGTIRSISRSVMELDSEILETNCF